MEIEFGLSWRSRRGDGPALDGFLLGDLQFFSQCRPLGWGRAHALPAVRLLYALFATCVATSVSTVIKGVCRQVRGSYGYRACLQKGSGDFSYIFET